MAATGSPLAEGVNPGSEKGLLRFLHLQGTAMVREIFRRVVRVWGLKALPKENQKETRNFSKSIYIYKYIILSKYIWGCLIITILMGGSILSTGDHGWGWGVLGVNVAGDQVALFLYLLNPAETYFYMQLCDWLARMYYSVLEYNIMRPYYPTGRDMTDAITVLIRDTRRVE